MKQKMVEKNRKMIFRNLGNKSFSIYFFTLFFFQFESLNLYRKKLSVLILNKDQGVLYTRKKKRLYPVFFHEKITGLCKTRV
jgi:hypothetical protein